MTVLFVVDGINQVPVLIIEATTFDLGLSGSANKYVKCFLEHLRVINSNYLTIQRIRFTEWFNNYLVGLQAVSLLF